MTRPKTLDEASSRRLRTFGRTGGRPLSPARQGLIDDLLPTLAVPEASAGALAPHTLFENVSEVWLEIGFGGGEHLIEQVRRRPDVGFIGCEPFVDGMAKALAGVVQHKLGNLRLHMGDARDAIARLEARSISRVFILFPDPWPKKRQRKRRLIQPDFLDGLARVLADGGTVRFATDIADYATEALWRFRAHGGFQWCAERAGDWRMPPRDHVTTRYEAKRLGDCAPVWFDFVRRPRQSPDCA